MVDHRLRAPLRPLVAMLVALASVPAAVGGVAASIVAVPNVHYYVDGKHGSDTNNGTSLGSAFKTVKHAMDLTEAQGVTVTIVGYSDYVYHEQMVRPYHMPGTSAAPIIIEGYRPPSGPFVRPTISGALSISDVGSTRWTRPNATTYPDVWRTPWTAPILGYASDHFDQRMDRLFFDTENQLTRPVPTPTLSDLQSHPGSEFWDGTYLYVRLGRWDGVAIDTNPNHHQIVTPNYYGLVINQLSTWITIRDLNVVHAAPGIAFYQGSNHVTVRNVDVSFNYPAGIGSQASDATFSYVTGRRNTMQLFKIQDGAQRTLIDHATAAEHPAMGIKITDPGTGFTIVQNSSFVGGQNVPAWVATYSHEVQGIDIEQGAHDTTIRNDTVSGMVRGLVLYQVDNTGGPLLNTVVTGNYFANNLHAVELWDSKDGGNSTGNVAFSHNTYFHNGNAIFAKTTTTNKTFDHETIYGSYAASGTASAAVLIQGLGTHLAFTNSIFANSPRFVFYVTGGASATVSYSDVYGYTSSKLYGSGLTWGKGIRTTNPAFVSVTPGTSGFLALPAGSTLLTASSTGTRIGSK